LVPVFSSGTIWESWTDTTNSHNHPALSATFSKYLYSLAGIDLEDPAIWLERRLKVFVHPDVAAAVRSAEGNVETTAGRISIKWSVDSDANRASLEATIPSSFSADLHVVLPRGCHPADVEVIEQWSGGLVYQGQGAAAAAAAAALGYERVSLVQHPGGGHTVRVVAPAGDHVFQLRCSH